MLNDVLYYPGNLKTSNNFEVYENKEVKNNFYSMLMP